MRKTPDERGEAQAALDSARAAKAVVQRQGVEVNWLMRSLNQQLETNGFSVRIARSLGMDDDRT